MRYVPYMSKGVLIAGGGDRRRLKPTMVSLRLLVLDFIHDYIAQWRYGPSLSEIAAAVHIDRSQARKAVLSLAASGLVLKAPGTRGIALPDQRDEAIRLLKALGWNVDDAGRLATNRPLMEGPAIDYIPPPRHKQGRSGHHGDSRQGQHGREDHTAAGERPAAA
jgi:hypothetical protein